MNVPLLDLKQQYQTIRPDVEEALADIFASQYFINGPRVTACEEAIAEYCGCSDAVGTSSGTDALLVSLMAENIGAGDEVITSSYTFFATAGSIARTGATPVFVDIDPRTFNIDPALIEARITDRTRAIMPVHLYGQVADMDAIMDIARRHKLVVIEDACQAIGAEGNGRRAGSIGDYGCFSFFPSKNLGGAGDGGMVTVNDPQRAEKLRQLRNHGSEPKYYHKLIGGNFRLDAVQAAVISIKLPHLDQWTEARQTNAALYAKLISESPALQETIKTPDIVQNRHIFNQFVIRTPRRDDLRAFLAENEIGSEIYYPVPLHRQECFAHLGYGVGSLPESEKAAAETLALPVYSELTPEQIAHVVNTMTTFFTN